MTRRSKAAFRPHLEQAEPRFLLSAAGAAVHAHVLRFGQFVEVARGAAYYLTTSLRANTPIYSLAVTNESGLPLQVTVNATNGRGVALQTNLRNGAVVPAQGRILLFTNDANGWFTLSMSSVRYTIVAGRSVLHAHDGKATSMLQGYRFPLEEHYATNFAPAHSNQFHIAVQGTGRAQSLVVLPG